MDLGLNLIDGCFDVEIKNGDVVRDDGLETAVTISLFTDRRVTEEEKPYLANSKRGYWGDLFSEIDGDKMGSRLWTLEREKRTTEVLRRAEDYTREALQWLIDDGVVLSISAIASYDNNKFINIDVKIIKPLGNESRYKILWDKQEIKRG
jgi:phage gp46-like protein